jgi:hypothetical protein
MSQVKFEQRENIRVTQSGGSSNGGAAPRGPPPPAPSQKEGFIHEVGEALTKGAGPNGYLAVSSGIPQGYRVLGLRRRRVSDM